MRHILSIYTLLEWIEKVLRNRNAVIKPKMCINTDSWKNLKYNLKNNINMSTKRELMLQVIYKVGGIFH